MKLVKTNPRLLMLTGLIRLLFFGASSAAWVTPLVAADSPREHLSLDAGWKFHLGDEWPDALSFVNSGTGSGPASEKFSDTYWRTVNVPHDWAVELPFDWAADGSHGFHTLGAKYVSRDQKEMVVQVVQ